jgi:asparagine synthase (glutamine-hydrolysing)
MCGIVGWVSREDYSTRFSLGAALKSIAHRGPDGEGAWRRSQIGEPFVVLGFRRLAILDLSDLGNQPMRSIDETLCIVFNGEIYNYKELRAELAALGHRFRSQGDTEVLLAAYQEWGAACVQRLNGMFAFAIWDERDHLLFAARDRFGEKPFFYYLDVRSGIFAFASEIKALLASGVCAFEINERALHRFVRDDVLDGHEETIYAGILRLPPGRSLTVKLIGGRVMANMHRYWNPAASGQTRTDMASAASRVRDLLTESVRLRLRSDVPVGTSLSGGLDSSAIVCLIRNLGAAAGQKTFSARMTKKELDEGEYIHAVRTQTGLNGYEVVPRPDEFEALFPALCYHLEEPFPTASIFAQHLVMRLAKENRVTVLLDGQGADELLGGYKHYFRYRYGDMARGGDVLGLRKELRAYSAIHASNALGLKAVLAAYLPEATADALRSNLAIQRPFIDWWASDWLAAESNPYEDRPRLQYFNRLESSLRNDSLLGPLQVLLRYGDRNSMAWSRELRQPFLDHHLAEFVFSLRPEFKIGEGTTKLVLRKAMKGIVPDVVLNRHDKLAYQAPHEEWLCGELKDWAEAGLAQAEAVLEPRLQKGIVERFRRLRHPLETWRDARNVMNLLTLCGCIQQLRVVAAAAAQKKNVEMQPEWHA